MGNCTCGRSNSKKDSTILTEEEMRFLLSNTKLNREQINALHYSFLEECSNGKMYKKDFLKLFKKAHPSENKKEKADKFCDYVFRVIDSENRGYITFKDFALCLNLTSFGDFRQKCEFAFKLYDLDKDGKISKKEMTQVLEALYDLSGIVDRKGDKSPAKKVEEVMNKLNQSIDNSPKSKKDFITKDQFIDGCFNDKVIKNLFIDSIFAKSSYDDDSLHSNDSPSDGKPKLCFLCVFKSIKSPDIHDNSKINTQPIKVANVNLTEFQPVKPSSALQSEEKHTPVVDRKVVSNIYQEAPNFNNVVPSQYYYEPPERIIVETRIDDGQNLVQNEPNLKLDEKEIYQLVEKYTNPLNSTSYNLIDSNNVIPIEITIRRSDASQVATKPEPSFQYETDYQQRNYISNNSPDIELYKNVPLENRLGYEADYQQRTYISNNSPDKEVYITVPLENKLNYQTSFQSDYYEQGHVELIKIPSGRNSSVDDTNLPILNEKEIFDYVDKVTSQINARPDFNPVETNEEITTHNIDITLSNLTADELNYKNGQKDILEKMLIDDFIQEENLKKEDVKIEGVIKEVASTTYTEPISGDQVNIENMTTDIYIDVKKNDDENKEGILIKTQIPVEIEAAIENEKVDQTSDNSIKEPTGKGMQETAEEPLIEPENLLSNKVDDDKTKIGQLEVAKEADANENKTQNENLIPLTKIALELQEDLKKETTPEVETFENKLNIETNVAKKELEPIQESLVKETNSKDEPSPDATEDAKSTNNQGVNNELKPTNESTKIVEAETDKKQDDEVKKLSKVNTESEGPSKSGNEESPKNEPVNLKEAESSEKSVPSENLNNTNESKAESSSIEQKPDKANEETKVEPVEQKPDKANEDTKVEPVEQKDSSELFKIVTEILANVSDEGTEIVLERKENETIVEISSNSDFEMKIQTTDDNGNNIITTIKSEQSSNENQDENNKVQPKNENQNEEKNIQAQITDLKEDIITAVITGDYTNPEQKVTLDIETKPNVTIEEVKVEIEKKGTDKIVDSNTQNDKNEANNDLSVEVANLVNEIVSNVIPPKDNDAKSDSSS